MPVAIGCEQRRQNRIDVYGSRQGGALIYADALAGNNAIVFINFGSDYSTSAGTFPIQWATTGIFTIDLTP